MAATEEDIRAALAAIREPNLGDNLVAAGVVGDIDIVGAGADIRLCFPYPAKSVFAAIVAAARPLLAARGVEARFRAEFKIHARVAQGGAERLPGVKNIVAVASAKGGVGKSTTTVNLALALAREGAAVGILDADVYGPSLPVMLGAARRPDSDNGGIRPVFAHGARVMSIGFLVGDDQPMAWRGPMATRALTQLLRETQWGELDYLFLDMPPGTGDIQLTIAQQIPVTGAIIVTTPQELAATDARRGLVMFNKVSIPVLGIVENMGAHRCPHCGETSRIFGAGGARAISDRYGVELLGETPLDAAICAAVDNGKPTVIADPEGDLARLYADIAVRAAVKIAEKSRDRSAVFPKIVIAD